MGKKEIRRGDSLIVDYEVVKLEKFDTEAAAHEIAKVLKKHLPYIVKTKVLRNLDFVTRYKIELAFKGPFQSIGGYQMGGLNLMLSTLRKVTNVEDSIVWEEIKPKE